MNHNTGKFLLYIFIGLIFISCGKGLSPSSPDEEVLSGTGFSGTITFEGSWDDSIKWTVFILFKDSLKSESDFIITNFKYVSSPIPFGVNSYSFNTLTDSSALNLITPGEYDYLCVAQSKVEMLSLSRDAWFIAGIYAKESLPSEARKLQITDGLLVEDVNILCDFDNPPPQPPD